MTTEAMTMEHHSICGVDWMTTFSEMIEHELHNAAIGVFQDALDHLQAARRAVIEGESEAVYEFWTQMTTSLLMDADAAKPSSGDVHPVSVGVRAKVDELLRRDVSDRPHWASVFAEFLTAVK